MSEKLILQTFPQLQKDPNFKVTSKSDYKYNCIAWAAIYDDRWIWPPTSYSLDGVYYYWPENTKNTDNVSSFIEMFEKKGYEKCSSYDFEKGYRKIALYAGENETCTHGARQISNGLWTSKLGAEQDIQHGSPYSIEGDNYGKVYCIMKKKVY